MIGVTDIPLRLGIAAQLVAIGLVRAYFGAPGGKETRVTGGRGRSESTWLSSTLGVLAVLHFGAILGYLVNPSLLRWSAFDVGNSMRWAGIVASSLGVAGEIWAALSLGASYSPTLRIAEERRVVTAGPYRWIRHPLYAFWLPVMMGWGLAVSSWFIIVSGTILIFVLAAVRVPREEAMMLQGFGESYRDYMTRTGRFVPPLRTVRAKCVR
jgi:protein-S-isoprenylcysteine O-methyltransferase Ste14